MGSRRLTRGGTSAARPSSRHSFSSVIPAGEAGAGENVSIILLSEYLGHARQGSDTAPVQVWNRCPPGVAESRPGLALEKSGGSTSGTQRSDIHLIWHFLAWLSRVAARRMPSQSKRSPNR